MSQAPATMKEIEQRMKTPWVFTADLTTYSKETAKQVGQWMRSLVNSGDAIRFNQKWPGNKTEAEGKTIISTVGLAAAAHNQTQLRFGALDYKVNYYKPEGAKYGTVFCFHKGQAPGVAQQILDITFDKIQRRAMLLDATQHDGCQQFEYHEQYRQYLITTPLSAKATKAFDAVLAELEAGLVEEPMRVEGIPLELAAPYGTQDTGLEGVTGLACTDCQEPTAVMQPCPLNGAELALCAGCVDERADHVAG